MFIQIDHGDGLPVYDQIVRQVKFAVADAVIRPGELVPSVRELARELAINPNTVARAYRCLQDDDVLARVRGTGLAVAPASRKRCRAERTEMIRTRLRQVLGEAIRSGLPEDDIVTLVRRELDTLSKRQPKGRDNA
jgi:GntR family transcriptional regulator